LKHTRGGELAIKCFKVKKKVIARRKDQVLPNLRCIRFGRENGMRNFSVYSWLYIWQQVFYHPRLHLEEKSGKDFLRSRKRLTIHRPTSG
jgi:hypothetical protein